MANNIKKVNNVNGGAHHLGNIEKAAIRGVEQGANAFSGPNVFSSTNTLSGTTTQSGAMIYGTETVAAGDGDGTVTLNAAATFHFVTTATNSTHVNIADGTTGQIKYVIHKTRSNTTDLVITPANFAAGTNLTSNAASRSVGLVFDGTNWQVISGEITGTAEMVIG
tara:strand:+ start:200 stop:697 length:498 start_codon:yes stop_codon:yes gene_type:complete